MEKPFDAVILSAAKNLALRIFHEHTRFFAQLILSQQQSEILRFAQDDSQGLRVPATQNDIREVFSAIC